MSTAYFSDEEVDGMCAGLQQNAAKVRHLKRLGLKVDRKPNGRPLAWRPAPANAEQQSSGPAHNLIGMDQWYAARRAQRGQKTQGR